MPAQQHIEGISLVVPKVRDGHVADQIDCIKEPIEKCNKILYKVIGIFSVSNAQQLFLSY